LKALVCVFVQLASVSVVISSASLETSVGIAPSVGQDADEIAPPAESIRLGFVCRLHVGRAIYDLAETVSRLTALALCRPLEYRNTVHVDRYSGARTTDRWVVDEAEVERRFAAVVREANVFCEVIRIID
jgi:hypothetical protein